MTNIGNPELITQIMDMQKELGSAVKNYRKYGLEFSDAEARYQAKKAFVAEQMKASGASATFISEVLKGKCADELKAREEKKAIYETQKEYVNYVKTNIRILEGQINREWGLSR